MRIGRLAAENPRTQGPERRAWYRRHNPEHPQSVEALIEVALGVRGAGVRKDGARGRAVVLGAGACTELPLERLARELRAVRLVDVDVAGMALARDGMPASVRSRVDLLQADLTGGVSEALAGLLRAQPWDDLRSLGPAAALEAAASCLESCPVPIPPTVSDLIPQGYGLVISSLVVTQLFSLPLLDVLDTLSLQAPTAADRREESPRYVAAARDFRRRVCQGHLALMDALLAPGGTAVFITDRVGELVPPRAGPHAHLARESLATLPTDVLAIPDDLAERFGVVGAARTWRWLVSAPTAELPGRAYDVIGLVLRQVGEAA